MKIYALAIFLAFSLITSNAQNKTVTVSDGADTTISPTPLAPQTETVDQQAITMYYSQGVMNYLFGKPEVATRIFTGITKVTDSAHAPSLYYLSRISMEQGDTLAAIRYIKEATDVQPDNLTYLKSRAQLLIAVRDLTQAIKLLDHITKLAPDDSETRAFNAISNYFAGNTAAAIDIINGYEARFGFDSRLTELKRQYYIDNKRYGELKEYTERVVAASPTEPLALISLAQIYASLGQDSLAIEMYNNALNLDSTYLESHMAIADFYRIKGDTTMFRHHILPLITSPDIRPEGKTALITDLFQMGADVRSPSTKALIDSLYQHAQGQDVLLDYYAEYQVFTGNYDAAIIPLQILREKGTLPPAKTMLLAQLYHQKGDLVVTNEIIEQRLAEDPADHEIAAFAVFFNSELGRTKRAMQCAKNMIRYMQTDSLKSVAYTIRGDLLHQMGKKSMTDYKKALQYDPNNAVAMNNWAYFLALDGKNLDLALKMALRANELDPQNPTYIDTHAWVLFSLGRLAEAKQAILLALGLQKIPSADLLLHAGDILEALGDKQGATRYWNRAAQAGAPENEVQKRLNK